MFVINQSQMMAVTEITEINVIMAVFFSDNSHSFKNGAFVFIDKNIIYHYPIWSSPVEFLE